MIEINNDELRQVDGGAFNVGIAVAIAAGITFIVGVIDGIVRPLKCN